MSFSVRDLNTHDVLDRVVRTTGLGKEGVVVREWEMTAKYSTVDRFRSIKKNNQQKKNGLSKKQTQNKTKNRTEYEEIIYCV